MRPIALLILWLVCHSAPAIASEKLELAFASNFSPHNIKGQYVQFLNAAGTKKDITSITILRDRDRLRMDELVSKNKNHHALLIRQDASYVLSYRAASQGFVLAGKVEHSLLDFPPSSQDSTGLLEYSMLWCICEDLPWRLYLQPALAGSGEVKLISREEAGSTLNLTCEVHRMEMHQTTPFKVHCTLENGAISVCKFDYGDGSTREVSYERHLDRKLKLITESGYDAGQLAYKNQFLFESIAPANPISEDFSLSSFGLLETGRPIPVAWVVGILATLLVVTVMLLLSKVYRQRPRPMVRRTGLQGFTLVELLVVLAIISVVVSITLPAVQAARETSRNLSCVNNLKQLGIALHNHETVHRHLPSNGWGYIWVSDPAIPGRGSWIFPLLRYMEQSAVLERAQRSGLPKSEQLSELLQQRLNGLNCPSRSDGEPTAYLGIMALANAEKPLRSFKMDYAGCGGNIVQLNSSGPSSTELSSQFHWPLPGNGLFYSRSFVRFNEITDGLSATYAIGEKFVSTHQPLSNLDRDYGNDQGAIVGDDYDNRRWTALPPARDADRLDSFESFGSRHSNTWNVLLADGSVHSESFDIDALVHAQFGDRASTR